MMHMKLLVFCCCIAGSLAWLAPERCKQGKSRRASGPTVKKDATTVTASEIARLQQARMEKDYKKYNFTGVPVRTTCDTYKVDIFAAYNCKFHTYAPRAISSVACTKAGCTLSRSVSTVDTYTADEGYNWGVTISTKVSVPLVFEVGAEASTGGEYSCSYTKGKTITDLVECAAGGKNGQLQLYSVQTDMICEFGTINLVQDIRDYKYSDIADNYFTEKDLKEIKDNTATYFSCNVKTSIMIDTSKISNRLLEKIIRAFPKYDPYTDVLILSDDFVMVNYYKRKEFNYEYKKVIPFTNENGDSVYQYACVYEER